MSFIENLDDKNSFVRGDAISWASKKQTCITISTIKSEFVALATIGRIVGNLVQLRVRITPGNEFRGMECTPIRFTQHKINMDEAISVSCVVDKILPSWKDFKHTLKHKNEELTLVELGSYLRIRESLGAYDNDKPKRNNVAGPSVLNMKNLVSSSVLNNCGYKQVIESDKFVLSKHAFMLTSKLTDSILWLASLGYVYLKRMQDMYKDGLITTFNMETKKIWQKKMHFLLSSMSVVYVLSTPILDDGDDATIKQIRKRSKWENDDYVCRGLILKGMLDALFNIYRNVESSQELWDSLEAKYIDEDASSKKFL
nr:zinc finger, CCHC-type [Tanacetum cinerariifolium]